MSTEFSKDYNIGLMSVDTYIGYLNSLKIPYKHADELQQQDDIDLVVKGMSVEVKHETFPDRLCIEEVGSQGKPGWIYTSKAQVLISVDDGQEYFYQIDFIKLKDWYNKCKHHYELRNNDASIGYSGDTWVSQYRVIPISDISGYVSVFKINL